MTELTQNERSLVQAMQKSRDHEWRGFKLLLERRRGGLEKFLDPLREAGLLGPDRNPPPTPADDEGRVHVPYWPPLDYLAACASEAEAGRDDDFAARVMDVVRNVSGGTDEEIEDNFHTARRFAEIIGLLPTAVVKIKDTDLVARWLGARFSAVHVVRALDEGALRKFLASDDPRDGVKAARIVRHCTALLSRDPKYSDAKEQEPFSRRDERGLSRLVDHHASDLGRKAPSESAALFEQRIREVFGRHEYESYSVRPAVEEHSQNRSGVRLANSFVAALRDVLLRWCDVDGAGAKDCVKRLLRSDVQMLRRIGIHVLNKRWPLLGGVYPDVVAPELFQEGHVHELYALLKERFEGFSDAEKARTLEAVRRIPPPAGEDAKRQLQFRQFRWLSAIASTRCESVAKWLSELRSAGVSVSDHPDFNVYVGGSTFGGLGNSPYQVRELVAFAEDRSLVERLNAFRPADDPRGPTVGALAGALSQAVRASPETFRKTLPEFVDAARPYQIGVINGFKAFWEASREPRSTFDWDGAWRDLVEFFGRLTGDPAFWSDVDASQSRCPRDSMVCAIADFLKGGTDDDAHACPESVLPDALTLIRRFLEMVDSTAGADDRDPMMSAIKTARGRTIEALFSHALRCCRMSDRRSGSHDDVWSLRLQSIFDEELRKCRDGNYEFSTLAGACLVNLNYMSPVWLRDSVARIFPIDAGSNFSCAVAGLAYSASTRRTYVTLRDAGVVEHALKLDLKGRETRRMLIESMMKAYLWAEETRDSPRMRHPFEHDAVEDLLDAAHFFWMIRGDGLSRDQRAMIIDYWEDCFRWASSRSSPPSELLGALGCLAWAMETIDDRSLKMLLASAPHVQRNFNSYLLLEQLERFVETNPAAVGKVLTELVDAGLSVYDDDKGRLESLIRALDRLGERKAALHCCNKLIAQPGMDDLYKRLTAAAPSSAA